MTFHTSSRWSSGHHHNAWQAREAMQRLLSFFAHTVGLFNGHPSKTTTRRQCHHAANFQESFSVFIFFLPQNKIQTYFSPIQWTKVNRFLPSGSTVLYSPRSERRTSTAESDQANQRPASDRPSPFLFTFHALPTNSSTATRRTFTVTRTMCGEALLCGLCGSCGHLCSTCVATAEANPSLIVTIIALLLGA